MTVPEPKGAAVAEGQASAHLTGDLAIVKVV